MKIECSLDNVFRESFDERHRSMEKALIAGTLRCEALEHVLKSCINTALTPAQPQLQEHPLWSKLLVHCSPCRCLPLPNHDLPDWKSNEKKFQADDKLPLHHPHRRDCLHPPRQPDRHDLPAQHFSPCLLRNSSTPRPSPG